MNIYATEIGLVVSGVPQKQLRKLGFFPKPCILGWQITTFVREDFSELMVFSNSLLDAGIPASSILFASSEEVVEQLISDDLLPEEMERNRESEPLTPGIVVWDGENIFTSTSGGWIPTRQSRQRNIPCRLST